MFESTHAFPFFDYFRVPYEITGLIPSDGALPDPVGRFHARDTAGPNRRSLIWLRSDATGGRRVRARLGRYRLDGFSVVGHVAHEIPASLLQRVGRGWRPTQPILDADGRAVSSVWTDQDGSVFLPFDPGEVMQCLWSERYTTIGRAALTRRARRTLVRAYYLVRPLLPRPVQMRLRRTMARRQTTPDFPAWPIEHSLHDMYAWLFATATAVAGMPVPWLDPWPDGKSWSLVLTHDVETHVGYHDMALLRDVERAHGYRSSWNFVPERYDVDDATVRALQDEGCEVGLHGLRHDGKDLGSPRLLARRLPAMRAYAARWNAVGFRSPATQRSWELMPRLGFDYDTSYTDTDPYEPQPGGCCTYLPFFNQQLVELPITLPQDHTLFSILQHRDGELWIRKARELRDSGGMVLVLTHPDYARDQRSTEAWRQLLGEFAGDQTVWQALPREVASWWRRRASSSLCRDGDGWVVRGPAAAEGCVRLTEYAPSFSSGKG
jgi:peptidoglycan/xylan/chitin deacetylase (PgdA/CDA1 family)